MLSVRERSVCLRLWARSTFTVYSARPPEKTVLGTRYFNGRHCYSLSYRLPSVQEVRPLNQRCYCLLATLRPFLRLHPIPPSRALLSPHRTWNKYPLAFSSSASGGVPPDKSTIPMFLLSLLVSVGCILLYVFVDLPSLPGIIDCETFLKLLERGEIQCLALQPKNRSALATLHDVYPGTRSKLVYFRIRQPPKVFEKEIRQKERSWGIPEDDALHIEYKYFPQPSLLPLNATSLALALTWFAIGVFFALGKCYIRFPGKTVSARHHASSHKPEANGSDSSNSTSWRDNHTGDRPDSGRFTGGYPFLWDPFSGFKAIKPVVTNVKFKDVAGMHASKLEVMEFVSYLKDPAKYQALGAKLPKGALLLGPPGTGKTLLVKALASEAGVPFFSMAGSEFVEVIGGLGASRIRQLFRVARSNAPAIIFIDELDSIGRRRHGVDTGGRRGSQSDKGDGSSEMEQTLNQLLAEMDGMDTAENTIVFAATNRADLLDKALLRAGRFDRHIYIDLPNLEERKELFAMYTAKYLLAPSVDRSNLIKHFAALTPGMSRADIAGLCNEAALIAARRSDFIEGVTVTDFDAAYERILAGAAKRSNPLSPPERRVAAVQEAGRALVAWLLPRSGVSLVKVSIVPRTTAETGDAVGLGHTYLAPEERRLFNTEELSDRMAILLGGRAAEQVIFNAVSDASQRYLQQASSLALQQVSEWGMSKVIGNLSFESSSSENELALKPYSQRTQALIEMEAQQLVSAAFTRCVQLLQSNKSMLQRLIDALLQREVLTYEDLDKICSDAVAVAPTGTTEA